MPREAKKTTRKPSWSAVRQQLANADKQLLIELLKDLYETNSGNRDFINARCLATEDRILESYRSKIVEQFYPERGEGKLKLAEARKAIRDYHKATGSASGKAELLMTFVENGVKFTNEYGDIDERFYSSVESALDELATLLRDEESKLYARFSKRLAKVERDTDGIGWGFHDTISDVVSQLAADLDDD